MTFRTATNEYDIVRQDGNPLIEIYRIIQPDDDDYIVGGYNYDHFMTMCNWIDLTQAEIEDRIVMREEEKKTGKISQESLQNVKLF